MPSSRRAAVNALDLRTESGGAGHAAKGMLRLIPLGRVHATSGTDLANQCVLTRTITIARECDFTIFFKYGRLSRWSLTNSSLWCSSTSLAVIKVLTKNAL